MHPSLANSAKHAIPLHAVLAKDAKAWLARQRRAGLLIATRFRTPKAASRPGF
jgi:hypothetical protein